MLTVDQIHSFVYGVARERFIDQAIPDELVDAGCSYINKRVENDDWPRMEDDLKHLLDDYVKEHGLGLKNWRALHNERARDYAISHAYRLVDLIRVDSVYTPDDVCQRYDENLARLQNSGGDLESLYATSARWSEVVKHYSVLMGVPMMQVVDRWLRYAIGFFKTGNYEHPVRGTTSWIS